MEKAIVTGVTGFIGCNLANHLISQGVEVYGIARDETKCTQIINSSQFNFIKADFSAYEKLSQLIEASGIDVFYHLAWGGGFLRDALENYHLQLENVVAAGDAIQAAVKLGCKRFVYAGTINEIEIQQLINNYQTFSTRPTCIYGTSKLAAELICKTIAQREKIQFNAGLIPMLYGVGNTSKQLINVVLESLMDNCAPKLIKGDNLYDVVYVGDIVRGLFLIGEAGINQKRYYIGHRKLKSFREWMIEIRDIINSKVELEFGAYADPLNLDYSLIDLDALYCDTGFECTADFRKSLINTARWLHANRRR